MIPPLGHAMMVMSAWTLHMCAAMAIIGGVFLPFVLNG